MIFRIRIYMDFFFGNLFLWWNKLRTLSINNKITLLINKNIWNMNTMSKVNFLFKLSILYSMNWWNLIIKAKFILCSTTFFSRKICKESTKLKLLLITFILSFRFVLIIQLQKSSHSQKISWFSLLYCYRLYSLSGILSFIRFFLILSSFFSLLILSQKPY